MSSLDIVEKAVIKVSRVGENISSAKSVSALKYGAKMKTTLGVAGAYIAVGTAADMTSKVVEHSQVKRQKSRDLKAERKKERESGRNRNNKIMNDISSLPFDLFNDRIGHTNMGNARF